MSTLVLMPITPKTKLSNQRMVYYLNSEVDNYNVVLCNKPHYNLNIAVQVLHFGRVKMYFSFKA